MRNEKSITAQFLPMNSITDRLSPIVSISNETLNSTQELLPVVRGAVETYEQAIGVDEREDLREHAERVTNLVCATADELVPDEVYIVCQLHDIVDRLYETSSKSTPARQYAASEAILEVFTHPDMTPEMGNYLKCLLADLPVVEHASEKYRRDMATAVSNGSTEVSQDIIRMVSDQYIGIIPPEVFVKTQPMMDFEHMGELLHQVNIESFIIKANELYDNMRSPSSLRESALLQDILEAESFYAPICEELGFDGLAAMLRGEANQARLRKQQKYEAITLATEKTDELKQIGPKRAFNAIFGDTYNNFASLSVGPEGDGVPPVYIGEFIAEDENGKLSVGNWRIKTVGSLAKKLNESDDMPMDMFGVMVIEENVKNVADAFIDFVSKRQGAIQLQPSPSRNYAISVQGSEAYKSYIAQRLADAGITDVEIKDLSPEEIKAQAVDPYEVTKVTFMAHDEKSGIDIPTEMQFVTKEERRRARTGEVMHIIYKYIKQLPEEPSPEVKRQIIKNAMKVACEIFERKSYIGPVGLDVNKYTEPRGDEMIEKAMKVYDAWDERPCSYDTISA